MKTNYSGPESDPVWASERIDELEDQNADLLAALKAMLVASQYFDNFAYQTQDAAEAAIAKTEGRKVSLTHIKYVNPEVLASQQLA